MKKSYISPLTSLLMSLSLVAGIFVAGLTNSRVLPAAKAQSLQSVTIYAPDATLAGTVIAVRGVVINGVVTDALIPGGVRVSSSLVDAGCGLTAVGSSETGGVVYALGVFTSGNVAEGDEPDSAGGVFTSGNVNDVGSPSGVNGVFTSGNDAGADGTGSSVNGVFTSGNISGGGGECSASGVFTSGNVIVGESLEIIGGALSGSNIKVIDGVVSGSDLQITGGYVTNGCGN